MEALHTLPSIFAGSFIIGFSGAMMPGPMLTVTVREAARKGFWSGPLVVLGHAILELSLVVALLAGLAAVVSNPWFLGWVGLLGGSVLLWMAWGMLRSAPSPTLALEAEDGGRGGPVLGGVVTSLTNPYFTLWWATVGLSYLTLAAGHGWRGGVAFYSGHILSDLVWYSLVSGGLHLGRRFLSDRLYRGLVVGCALLLLYFGFAFTRSGLEHLWTAV